MKILFIGDSITDADRDRNDPAGLGTGYVSLFAEKLAPLYEDTQFVFVNRGVSGDRIFDIAARLDGCLAEKADIVVLLAGINDVWHKYTDGLNFDPEAFAECYASVAQKNQRFGRKTCHRPAVSFECARQKADAQGIRPRTQRRAGRGRQICGRIRRFGRNLRGRIAVGQRFGIFARRHPPHPPRGAYDCGQPHQKDPPFYFLT